MDTINGRFTIHIDGKLVSNDLGGDEPPIHAKLGSDPATFTLSNGVLECGDCYLGRWAIEDRSLLPKRVYWFKKSQFDRHQIQPTTAVPDGDSYQLRLGGLPLKARDGHVYVDMMEVKVEV
ncbi:hypothetical protein N7463_002490 [Penicillium fimorum]|uniref:Uncharacterized protein n=1 Tax=Penicillium fimorum TaxID=1882269 RepID=A0A9W9XZI1_9EURO|nr:hypothetical protein N7463_002490 [Penicillium fimorum]